jgi:TonB family protein
MKFVRLIRCRPVFAFVLGLALARPAFAADSEELLTTQRAHSLVLYSPRPDYPYLARVHHKVGRGIFQLHITADGKVSSVETLQSTGYKELDESSITTLSKWRFRNVGHAATTRIPITFSMRGHSAENLPGSTHGQGIQGAH